MKHHHNALRASYLHTRPNGMTRKSKPEHKKGAVEKETCQGFHDNRDTSLVFYCINGKTEH